MILDEIVLHNFGVYKGRQTIQLASSDPKRPIVLFGSLNGGGKTTLVDGIHLALYGPRARCSNRGTLAYDEYLRRTIHRGVEPPDGAAVELQFRQWADGKEETYRVHRSWRGNGSGIRERVEVVKDGAIDRVLTERWAEQVECFIPNGISSLFLFDGEKIERLADAETSRELLSTAITSLLGLDVVDQLGTDLRVLARRKRSQGHSQEHQATITAVQQELEDLEARRKILRADQGDLDRLLQNQREGLRLAEEELRLSGGDLYESREALEAAKDTAATQLRGVQEQLRDLGAGPLPLLLLQGRLEEMAFDADLEIAATGASTMLNLLEARDSSVLRILKEQRIKKATVEAIEKFLEEDRALHAETAATPVYLSLTNGAHTQLDGLLGEVVGDLRQRLGGLLDEADSLQSNIVDCDRKLAGVPDEDAIRELIQRRESAAQRVLETEIKYKALGEALEKLSREIETKSSALQRKIHGAFSDDLLQQDDLRILDHSAKMRSTISQFRQALVKRHVERIQKLVLDSFQKLLRKQSLVDDMHIDPKTYAVRLATRTGEVLTPERLSAGERQLLAVSFLWGLARASGRPLPTVIDTPLGRLDGSHRMHLVQRYFPNASHQVLLLSTDEEIEGEYYAKLKKSIGRSYTLEHNDKAGHTTVRPGYFAEA